MPNFSYTSDNLPVFEPTKLKLIPNKYEFTGINLYICHGINDISTKGTKKGGVSKVELAHGIHRIYGITPTKLESNKSKIEIQFLIDSL